MGDTEVSLIPSLKLTNPVSSFLFLEGTVTASPSHPPLVFSTSDSSVFLLFHSRCGSAGDRVSVLVPQ